MKVIGVMMVIGVLLSQYSILALEVGKYAGQAQNDKVKHRLQSQKNRIVNNMGSESALEMAEDQQQMKEDAQDDEPDVADDKDRKLKKQDDNVQGAQNQDNESGDQESQQQMDAIESITDKLGMDKNDDEPVEANKSDLSDDINSNEEDDLENITIKDVPEDEKVPLGQECGNQNGDYTKNMPCQGNGICRAYCSRGDENLEFNKCEFWCVAPNGESCEGHFQCQSEFCNNGVCSKRKGKGEACELKNECLSYSCDQKKCVDIPSFVVPETLEHTNDKGEKCKAEVELPTSQGMPLSSCSAQNKEDLDSCGFKNNICEDGRCRIKYQNWCYPGNENLSCLNVCQKGSYCIKRYIRKTGYVAGGDYNPSTKYDQDLANLINKQNDPYKRNQRILMFFDDMLSVLKKRNSGLQRMMPDKPNPLSYIQAYQCLNRLGDETVQCSNNKNCETGKCVNNNCVQLDNEKTCYQNWECKSGACVATDENQDKDNKKPKIKFKCQDKKSDENICEQGDECQSGLCARNLVACIGKAIPPQDNDFYQKYCQPKGTYILNNECKEDSQCGIHNGIQMKCLRSNVIQQATDRQLGLVLDLALRNMKQSFLDDDYKFQDDRQLQKYGVDKQQLWSDMKQMYSFKCKIPTNQKCLADFECPKNNICKQYVCRGQMGAPCASYNDCDYSEGFICAFNDSLDSPMFATMTCQPEKPGDRRRRLARKHQ